MEEGKQMLGALERISAIFDSEATSGSHGVLYSIYRGVEGIHRMVACIHHSNLHDHEQEHKREW